MKTQRSLMVRIALFLSLLIVDAVAQSNGTAQEALVGRFEVRQENGDPFPNGLKVDAIFTPPLPVTGLRAGSIYLNGEHLPQEDMVIVRLEDGSYFFRNRRGNTGRIYYQTGHYYSEMTSGSNTGTKRRLVRG